MVDTNATRWLSLGRERAREIIKLHTKAFTCIYSVTLKRGIHGKLSNFSKVRSIQTSLLHSIISSTFETLCYNTNILKFIQLLFTALRVKIKILSLTYISYSPPGSYISRLFSFPLPLTFPASGPSCHTCCSL